MEYSETPKLQPIVPKYHLRVLSDEQLEQFKSATLTILEEVGICLLYTSPSPRD